MSGARILVGDDEPQIVRAIAPQLEARGYRVFTTASGREALHALTRWRPDLILLDLMLPDVSGLEVGRGIRQERQTPLTFLSARAEARIKIDALYLCAGD